MPDQTSGNGKPFRVEEATIVELHQAIRDGRTTCVDVVRQYIERVRAYNGVASMLVTEDGAAVPEAAGAVRGQAPLRFPTQTIKASTLLPDLDKYQGPPLEFGRMEPTASDPSVQQQFGMITGIPDARQLNALATLTLLFTLAIALVWFLLWKAVRAARGQTGSALQEFAALDADTIR